MTVSRQEVLKSFDKLPDTEQVEIGIEILKRLVNIDFPPLTDEDLVLNAEAVFLSLDEQEVHHE
ncbi:MAG: hypothetical protein RLZZ490_1332 [Cyanobacteriota bacterium]|jgi:hypothetical protein